MMSPKKQWLTCCEQRSTLLVVDGIQSNEDTDNHVRSCILFNHGADLYLQGVSTVSVDLRTTTFCHPCRIARHSNTCGLHVLWFSWICDILSCFTLVRDLLGRFCHNEIRSLLRSRFKDKVLACRGNSLINISLTRKHISLCATFCRENCGKQRQRASSLWCPTRKLIRNNFLNYLSTHIPANVLRPNLEGTGVQPSGTQAGTLSEHFLKSIAKPPPPGFHDSVEKNTEHHLSDRMKRSIKRSGSRVSLKVKARSLSP